MASKAVRFYTPFLVDEDENVARVQPGFWRTAHATVAGLTATERRIRYFGPAYRGSAEQCRAPSQEYLSIGRIRYAAEWPDVVDHADQVTPLQVPGGNLVESAYVVPFGTANKVAIMGPIRGLVSVGAIERWLSIVLGLAEQGLSVQLQPELDRNVMEKLNSAVAVSKVHVRVPADAELQMPDGRKAGDVETAFEEAVAANEGQMDVELTFSHGHRRPATDVGDMLKRFGQRLARATGPDKIDVSMLVEHGKQLKVEHHDLVEDTISLTARFNVDDNQQLTEREIIDGILDTVRRFGQV